MCWVKVEEIMVKFKFVKIFFDLVFNNNLIVL